ncbi:some similarities with Saccharomyces cerevisiae YHL025W SNF6 Subunit of the SWI/SNF chromatin remodeling complex involved in transcriptional regulation [Maudiozyma barnettii]|uniref:Some similarities with Saccharomyces cerevisiae YHL025W SNF6 Subunit of the SWI/SNF chromatin remodeling complex involved in transcriptional regulation n=1 Tax=Maudiozyma barnettii TaxID=61262 RepID=A0A8H2VD49_9SACH|nr:Snf6p [Kazachstania barnettii]CAB4253002.1 some similarities with Saccharomyces cerevisiae YHL025W SNF6 Subunit of the SWI/SNF chromatin remodeling complex involved in transcriptional regulation [Kazachstania barnettii]CAD1780146.1 some similarities with Saccharomyces cerevisiae YHL025W SNF6 Subunit of the SWI/SNF chromatin remodeling complex involved in transcriptional regulation [Kazachstania barnettii]
MAVIKKKRSHHAKGNKQAHLQQLQQQMQQQQIKDNEANRLKPEQVNSIVHDESDTISFRANLLKNFILSTDFMNALTNQPVPLSKIKPPRVFQSLNPVTLRNIITTFKTKVEQEQTLLDELKRTSADLDVQELHLDLAKELDNDISVYATLEHTEDATRQYCDTHGLRSQDRRIVTHVKKFPSLKIDPSEAPNDYWDTTYKELIQERDMKIKEQKKKEEEERKEKELQRKREEEQKRAEEQKRIEEQRLRDLELQRIDEAQQRNSLQFSTGMIDTKMAPGVDSGITTTSAVGTSMANNVLTNPTTIRQSTGISDNNGLPSGIQLPSTTITATTVAAADSADIGSGVIQATNSNTTGTLNESNELSVGRVQNGTNGSSNELSQNTGTQQQSQQSQQQQQQPQPQQPQDNLLEDMFTEYNANENEPFSNGFDDEFGDGFENLDNVFF